MLNCFTTNQTENIIPLITLAKDQVEDWLKDQNTKTQNMVETFEFKAKSCQRMMICDEAGKLESVLVGIGDEEDLSVFGSLAQQLPEGVYSIKGLSKEATYHAYLSWGLGSYQFTPYKKGKALLAKLSLPEDPEENPQLQATLKATYLVRDLINTPAEDMMPADLAEAMMNLTDEFGGKVKTIIGDDLLKKNYPTIHAVGRASHHAPQLIDLRWGDKHHPKVTLVGKGVCFDSGGLDIKPPAGMLGMKKDMGGAAHVIGLAYIIMSLKLPINLRVLVPAVDNAISGNAYRPGDIIVTRKGISVEVTNTDAEGRLVLCDALDEAASESPELLLDFATLTGAARVALGVDIGAMFTDDDALAERLYALSEEEKDPLWRLPMHKPYRKQIESKVADILNAVLSGYGGAITAALFLKEFVPDEITWAHFDIMAASNKDKPTCPEGGEAHTLRTVMRYLCERFEK